MPAYAAVSANVNTGIEGIGPGVPVNASRVRFRWPGATPSCAAAAEHRSDESRAVGQS